MSIIADYSEALERQIALARYISSAAGQRFRQEVLQTTSPASEFALTYGQPYYWAPPICELLQTTAPTLPEVTFQPALLPSLFGFWWFAAPLALPLTSFNNGAPFNDQLAAISWCPVYWAEGDSTQRMIPLSGGEPEQVDAVVLDFYGPAMGKLLPIATWQWKAGESLTEALRRERDMDAPLLPARVRRMQYFAAGLLFLAQRILQTTHQPAARSTRRRLAHAGVPDAPLIRVVELRERAATTGPAAAHAPVAWSCRWIVTGHWRQQACGPARRERRPRWILPYLKGPGDRPLRPPGTKLFAVIR